MHARSTLAVLAAPLLALSTVAAAADNYTATPVPALPGGTGTTAFGVNNAGWVVGQADDFGALVAFVYRDGVTTALPSLQGGWDAKAVSVNSSGVIVGECRDQTGVFRAVMWTVDEQDVWTITDLGTFAPGDVGFGIATRINDAGQIVGYCTAESGFAYHGFLWDNGQKTDIGTLHYSGNNAYSQALGVSPNGDVVGFAYGVLQGPEHGLFLAVGARDAEDITPAAPFALAQWHAVNSGGMLGGYIASSSHTGGAFRPALYVGGSGYDIVPLIDGLTDGYGYDLNESGVFVGTMFLLDVDPELSIFKAFKHENGATVDLNTITAGLPGVLIEARDVSDDGLIVGTVDTGFGPQAVVLNPDGAACPADYDGNGTAEVADIITFLTDWFAGVRDAYEFGGTPGVPAIFAFLAEWFAGC